jgi:putative tricarboxylic transport membrane protein
VSGYACYSARIHSRPLWTLLAAAVLLVGCGGPRDGGSFPTEEIRILVPYTAGGPPDLAARTMGSHPEKALGQPVIVENLPGASGSQAYRELVSSDPDGHTLALVAAPSAVVTPMIQDVPYDAGSFVTIGVITEVPSVLAVGVPGATTSQAIELRRLANDYGVQVTAVPFNGSAHPPRPAPPAFHLPRPS